MALFWDTTPDTSTYWRSVILFGRNVASYKFALAKSLLELGPREQELIRLEDLAVPFAKHVCEHLEHNPKQSTSSTSKFLDTCRAFNEDEISNSDLIAATTKLGFVNVIDAFHVVNQGEIPTRFFLDERQESKGIRLTGDFFKMLESGVADILDAEVQARWRLVETAWSLGISRNLAGIQYDDEQGLLFVAPVGRRVTVTSSRNALNGYQKGRCFYCFDEISVVPSSVRLADVDHFFPNLLKVSIPNVNLDGVWNLVLSCQECNRGEGGKFAKLPDKTLLARLHTRNEFLIGSHHPLRETLMKQTGKTEAARRLYLQRLYDQARASLIHVWRPTSRADEAF